MLGVAVGCNWMPAGHPQGDPEKVCIAHRGASAYAPEHTLAAYSLAIDMGADYVEQDLQMTRDGVLICLHDTSLERTTNVEDVFADRYDAEEFQRSGRMTWRVADFTLQEIKRLDVGSGFGPEFAGERIPTFQESLDLVMGKAGIYPELKEPAYYDSFGMNMVDAISEVFRTNGLDTPEGQLLTPVFVQSFSPEALKEMKEKTGETYRLIQLISVPQARTLFSDEALPEVAAYACGLGPSIAILRADPSRITAARSHGLKLHPYTISQSNLPSEFIDLSDYTAYLLYDLGVEGVFTNNPDIFPREKPEP
jgi:glycerophosphoryl diester phosphodiesterase